VRERAGLGMNENEEMWSDKTEFGGSPDDDWECGKVWYHIESSQGTKNGSYTNSPHQR